AMVVAGETVSLDIHVVNDMRTPVTDATVDIVAAWPGGERRWRFGGDADADDVVKVGTIVLDVPDTLGALTFDLTLRHTQNQVLGVTRATNHYGSVITAV